MRDLFGEPGVVANGIDIAGVDEVGRGPGVARWPARWSPGPWCSVPRTAQEPPRLQGTEPGSREAGGIDTRQGAPHVRRDREC